MVWVFGMCRDRRLLSHRRLQYLSFVVFGCNVKSSHHVVQSEVSLGDCT